MLYIIFIKKILLRIRISFYNKPIIRLIFVRLILVYSIIIVIPIS